MKNNKMEDERVIIAKRKIQSDGFQIVWLVLMISVLIQQYLYKAEFTQYAVELLVLIAMSVYVLIANIGIGNDIFTSNKRGNTIIIVNSLVTGVIVSVVNTVNNYINYGDKIKHPVFVHIALVAGITFISATAFAFIALKFFYLINKKKQQAIDKKLNDDEMNE